MTKASALAPAQPLCTGCGTPNPPEAHQCSRCRRFLPGNRAGQRHGARASRDLQAATEDSLERIEAVVGDGPGSEPRYALARAAAARTLGRVELLERFLSERGLLDSKGRPRPATKLLEQAHTLLLRYLDALGLTPSAAGKLGVDLARGRQLSEQLDTLRERGREARQAAER